MRKSVQHMKCSGEIKSAELTQVVGTATLSVGNLLLSVTAEETDNKIREMANETYVNR